MTSDFPWIAVLARHDTLGARWVNSTRNSAKAIDNYESGHSMGHQHSMKCHYWVSSMS